MDVIARAESWFESQRRRHLSTEVEYRPAGGLPRYCAATLVIGKWEKVDPSGQIVRYETRDFFIGRDELPQDPRVGDSIVLVEDGLQRTYEVMVPEGGASAWSWGDRSQRVRRIHTIARAATPAAQPALLLRYTGASRATELTDAQIELGLSPDLAAGYALSRSISCDTAHVYVVLPASWVAEQAPRFFINGLETSAFDATARSATLGSQPATQYTIYRSVYPVTGVVQLEVA